MSTTTQILFNSPALHSLKRDQLVKLCKIHSIKASGKNVELIERLKQHANTLPIDELNQSDETTDDEISTSTHAMTRPSEQWEVVMDDIEEETSSQGSGTHKSMREFGTGSSKSSSMSSLKALASSFGLKRSNSKASTSASPSLMPRNRKRSTPPPEEVDELTANAKPYASLPSSRLSSPPQTDHLKLSTPDATVSHEPIPGHPSRPGVPATNGPTTTIRLVSSANSCAPGTPQLKPFATDFDLITSPGARGVPVWPLSPTKNLYPALPKDDENLYPALPKDDENLPMPGGLSASASPARPSNDVDDIFSPAKPFVFGSNHVSNEAFGSAAASVLAEMNRRLSAVGGQKVGSDLLENAKAEDGETRKTSGGEVKGQGRFNKVHEAQFNKMESIASHYAARRGADGLVPGTKKRKSEALGNGRPRPNMMGRGSASVATRVISAGTRKKMIPGGFDEGEASEEEEDMRMSKRVRVVEGDGGMDKGKRVSIAPKVNKEKERVAVKKMLEKKREKRRSGVRRMSGVTPKSLPANHKAKGSVARFGFLTSAKSIVKNAWNMGMGSNAKTTATASNTSIPVSKSIAPKPSTDTRKEAKPVNKPAASAKTTGSAGSKKAFGFAMMHRSASSGSARSSGSATVAASGSASKAAKMATAPASTTAFKARLPIPSFGATMAPTKTATATFVSPASRAGSIISTGTAKSKPVSTASSRSSTHPSFLAQPSSMGTKGTGHERTLSTSTTSISSIGMRRPPSAPSIVPANGSTKSMGRSSSTLYAPTASSLAKMRNPKTSLSKVPEPTSKTSQPALGPITNSPRRTGLSPVRTSPGKIFSRPLRAASSSSLPTPIKPTFFGAAASNLHTDSNSNGDHINRAAPASSLLPATTPRVMRKPRISRSRVIAKLGAQRAALAAGLPSSLKPQIGASSPRKQQSSGSGERRSYGGVMRYNRTASGEAVMLSAKKRARQSEYMRRRSRATGNTVGASSSDARASFGRSSMDVDED
ncbi:hypothetical protein EW146_g140 [Bondarzewia mesenterica]|uniref:SAP domain-containing protein n=1 Tax=Bondarzewia mesenterica TaxID=1095465 RepID=A0A4S4M7U0_9AGAM|nr:hypothetical protein EW146_g140 [Bondarzewia mesenterica]